MVFLLFVILFIYSVIQLINGKHILDTQMGVRLSQDELVRNRTLLPAGTSFATKPAPPGYAVSFNDHEYGTNSNGGLRLDLDTVDYVKLMATSRLEVKVLAPGVGMVEYEIPFDRAKLRLQSIILTPAEVGANLDLAKEQRYAASYSFFSTASAFAATGTHDRLFVRSIAINEQSNDVQNLLMKLEAADQVGWLKGDMNNQSSIVGELPVFGRSTVYEYAYFMDLPSGAQAGKVIVSSSRGFFKSAYVEEFPITVGEYGLPLRIQGTRGSTLVVQRMLPCDIVLFERLGTADLNARLNAELNKTGFIVRVNSGSSRITGDYNVLYAGNEVSYQLVQRVLRQLNTLGVRLKYLYYHLKLKSPSQNQIQIGSNSKFRCLNPIDNGVIQRMINAQSENDFTRTIEENMPQQLCPSD